ncbi:Putative uncharacterized protein [Lactobacillus equicursoris DSM 19284 = JCM 14600 = CIP 110162]|uniref:hypothetical protein n=1 Tax=Lactobacillus equicursoris TaxID=420645 RepID=UPI0002840434|nr:hypothetical protein [Lactobacillus equicursoris]CCK86359.1 Putative uncharacterized protein [Lactobacillus equicursoris DSM 19284 = JCM 14600 = CIP 110162]
MIEYETVEEALHALSEVNSAKDIKITDAETGKVRPATVEDIQQFNIDICYQLAGLLKIDLRELEA